MPFVRIVRSLRAATATTLTPTMVAPYLLWMPTGGAAMYMTYEPRTPVQCGADEIGAGIRRVRLRSKIIANKTSYNKPITSPCFHSESSVSEEEEIESIFIGERTNHCRMCIQLMAKQLCSCIATWMSTTRRSLMEQLNSTHNALQRCRR